MSLKSYEIACECISLSDINFLATDHQTPRAFRIFADNGISVVVEVYPKSYETYRKGTILSSINQLDTDRQTFKAFADSFILFVVEMMSLKSDKLSGTTTTNEVIVSSFGVFPLTKTCGHFIKDSKSW